MFILEKYQINLFLPLFQGSMQFNEMHSPMFENEKNMPTNLINCTITSNEVYLMLTLH